MACKTSSSALSCSRSVIGLSRAWRILSAIALFRAGGVELAEEVQERKCAQEEGEAAGDEAPNSKFQAPEKLQAPSSKAVLRPRGDVERDLGFLHCFFLPVLEFFPLGSRFCIRSSAITRL